MVFIPLVAQLEVNPIDILLDYAIERSGFDSKSSEAIAAKSYCKEVLNPFSLWGSKNADIEKIKELVKGKERDFIQLLSDNTKTIEEKRANFTKMIEGKIKICEKCKRWFPIEYIYCPFDRSLLEAGGMSTEDNSYGTIFLKDGTVIKAKNIWFKNHWGISQIEDGKSSCKISSIYSSPNGPMKVLFDKGEVIEIFNINIKSSKCEIVTKNSNKHIALTDVTVIAILDGLNNVNITLSGIYDRPLYIQYWMYNEFSDKYEYQKREIKDIERIIFPKHYPKRFIQDINLSPEQWNLYYE
jgi:uncharacterized protein YbaR (Trm112 family)